MDNMTDFKNDKLSACYLYLRDIRTSIINQTIDSGISKAFTVFYRDVGICVASMIKEKNLCRIINSALKT